MKTRSLLPCLSIVVGSMLSSTVHSQEPHSADSPELMETRFYVNKDFLRKGPAGDPATLNYEDASGKSSELGINGAVAYGAEKTLGIDWLGVYGGLDYQYSDAEEEQNQATVFAIAHFTPLARLPFGWAEELDAFLPNWLSEALPGDGIELITGPSYSFDRANGSQGYDYVFEVQPWVSQVKSKDPAKCVDGCNLDEVQPLSGMKAMRNLTVLDRTDSAGWDIDFAPRFRRGRPISPSRRRPSQHLWQYESPIKSREGGDLRPHLRVSVPW